MASTVIYTKQNSRTYHAGVQDFFRLNFLAVHLPAVGKVTLSLYSFQGSSQVLVRLVFNRIMSFNGFGQDHIFIVTCCSLNFGFSFCPDNGFEKIEVD